jgi:hypothetical protein
VWTCCPKTLTVNETSGIVTKSSSVSHQFSMIISGSTSTTTNTVCNVYMIIGRRVVSRPKDRSWRAPSDRRAMFVKKRERLIDEVSIELLAHVVLDVARHADQNPALQEEKETSDYTRAQHLWPAASVRFVQVTCSSFESIHADDEWNEKAGSTLPKMQAIPRVVELCNSENKRELP